LSGASTELAGAREDILKRWGALESWCKSSAPSQPDGKVDDRLLQLQEERAQFDQERMLLEAELEAVRGRAAEMAETLAEERRQTAQERAQWTQELKQMRRLMEMLSAQRFVPATPGEPHAMHVEPPEPVTAAVGGGDPILNSVVAQFEMLQKDRARRKKGSA
jgi:hypothetical protein